MNNPADKGQLQIGDLLLWAEDVLGIPASRIHLATKLGAAESALAAPFAGFGDVLLYEDAAQRAAILCSRLNRNHAFIDGNKRIAMLAMFDQLERAGLTWTEPEGGQAEIAEVIEDLAAGIVSEADFVEWVKRHTQ